MRLTKYKHPQKDPFSRLLIAVQKRASDNETKKQSRGFEEIHFSYDLIFKIFLLLPAESLHRSSFVCKAWFNLINSSNFVEAHIRQSETVLIFPKSVTQTRPNTFYIESKLSLSIFSTTEPSRSHYLDFVGVQDGKLKEIESNVSGFKNILATCNGLVLATRKERRGLLVINPVTRKVLALPRGTILSYEESYGFVFSHLSKEYKVVHLFRDTSRYIACEIMSLTTRSWWAVDGPNAEHFRSFLHKPVSANGSLHWLPDRDGCNCIVSMGIDDEKFDTRSLPISSSRNDRLVEIGGFLSFVTHVPGNTIEVWFLKECEGQSWVKQHTIRGYRISDLVPACSLRCGRELFFILENTVDQGRYFCAYDMETQEMREVEFEGLSLWGHRRAYLPHVITLASW
ncbi:F-box protein CPR1-like [Actinidia eriantha]|uniref:F-box protein CPR1-like n=1 Tax=Actinidia eriantha TaxID=165200 RepID=UPI00258C9DE5|nr:F-box protein CPR1-like [Actinidia eriantha]